VPLVDQQATFIESQVPLRVRRYFGQMGVDLWDRSRWEREFEEVDILVMTGQLPRVLCTLSDRVTFLYSPDIQGPHCALALEYCKGPSGAFSATFSE